jgi:hypothetical protein
MLPPQPKDKEKQKIYSGKKDMVDSSPAALEVNGTQCSDSQATDIMMSDAATLVDRSQAEDASSWEETHMAEDVDGTQVRRSCSLSAIS